MDTVFIGFPVRLGVCCLSVGAFDPISCYLCLEDDALFGSAVSPAAPTKIPLIDL